MLKDVLAQTIESICSWSVSTKYDVTLVSHSFSGCNAYALYRNIPSDIRKRIKVQFTKSGFDGNCKQTVFNKAIKKCKFVRMNASSKVVVSTHGYLAGSRRYIELWHGLPIKVMGYLARNLSDDEKKKLRRRFVNTDVLISTSVVVTAIFSSIFNVSPERFVVTGYPRNDLLFHPNIKKLQEIVGYRDLQRKKILFYLPTHRKLLGDHTFEMYFNRYMKGKAFEDILFKIEGFRLGQFISFLRRNNSVLVVKLHPFDEMALATDRYSSMNAFISKYGDIVKIITLKDLNRWNMDLYDLLGRADLLITDYSSVYNDFLLLDKPIIFWVPGVSDYEREQGILYDVSLLPGSVCKTQGCLQEAIEKYLSNPSMDKNKRQWMRFLIHKYIDDKSSYRVWKLIIDLLSEWG